MEIEGLILRVYLTNNYWFHLFYYFRASKKSLYSCAADFYAKDTQANGANGDVTVNEDPADEESDEILGPRSLSLVRTSGIYSDHIPLQYFRIYIYILLLHS